MNDAERKGLIPDEVSDALAYELFLQMDAEEKAASQFGTGDLTDEARDEIAAAMFKEAEKPKPTTET